MEVEIDALKQRVQGAEERLKDLTDIMMTIQHLSESVKQIADSVASMNTRVTAIELLAVVFPRCQFIRYP